MTTCASHSVSLKGKEILTARTIPSHSWFYPSQDARSSAIWRTRNCSFRSNSVSSVHHPVCLLLPHHVLCLISPSQRVFGTQCCRAHFLCHWHSPRELPEGRAIPLLNAVLTVKFLSFLRVRLRTSTQNPSSVFS